MREGEGGGHEGGARGKGGGRDSRFFPSAPNMDCMDIMEGE